MTEATDKHQPNPVSVTQAALFEFDGLADSETSSLVGPPRFMQGHMQGKQAES
jgi:hypothetical protein